MCLVVLSLQMYIKSINSSVMHYLNILFQLGKVLTTKPLNQEKRCSEPILLTCKCFTKMHKTPDHLYVLCNLCQLHPVISLMTIFELALEHGVYLTFATALLTGTLIFIWLQKIVVLLWYCAVVGVGICRQVGFHMITFVPVNYFYPRASESAGIMFYCWSYVRMSVAVNVQDNLWNHPT